MSSRHFSTLLCLKLSFLVLQIFTALAAGADIIFSNFPSSLSAAGLALVWQLNDGLRDPTTTTKTSAQGTGTAVEGEDGSLNSAYPSSASAGVEGHRGTSTRKRSFSETIGQSAVLSAQYVRMVEGKLCVGSAAVGQLSGEETLEDKAAAGQSATVAIGAQHAAATAAADSAAADSATATVARDGITVEQEDREVGIVNLWDRKHRKDRRPLVRLLTVSSLRLPRSRTKSHRRPPRLDFILVTNISALPFPRVVQICTDVGDMYCL